MISSALFVSTFSLGTYHCEWTKVVNDESERKKFRQFVNTDETQAQSEIVMERGQPRPADWSENATPLKFSPKDVAASAVWEFRPVCRLSDLDPQENAPTSAVVKYGDSQIALWNIPGRGLRAAQNMCPHRRAFVLSDGLCGEDAKGRDYISCPLHKRNYVLSHKEQDEPGSCNDADYQVSVLFQFLRKLSVFLVCSRVCGSFSPFISVSSDHDLRSQVQREWRRPRQTTTYRCSRRCSFDIQMDDSQSSRRI